MIVPSEAPSLRRVWRLGYISQVFQQVPVAGHFQADVVLDERVMNSVNPHQELCKFDSRSLLRNHFYLTKYRCRRFFSTTLEETYMRLCAPTLRPAKHAPYILPYGFQPRVLTKVSSQDSGHVLPAKTYSINVVSKT